MTQNYYRGQITVVFPATEKTPLFGKIMPIWGKNKNDQLNFNVYSLKENKLFPDDSGACEIDINDELLWTKKVNGNVEFYTPNTPVTVYFKLKVVTQRDGSEKLSAVAIHSPNKVDLEDRIYADGRKEQPRFKDLLSGTIRIKKNKKHKKAKQDQDEEDELTMADLRTVQDLDELNEGDVMDLLNQDEWGKETYRNTYTPIDNLKEAKDEDYIEEELERKEEDTLEEEEDFDKYYNSQQIQKKFKGNY